MPPAASVTRQSGNPSLTCEAISGQLAELAKQVDLQPA